VNSIDNTIMNSSVLWPNGPQDVAKRLPAGQVGADLGTGESAAVVRPPAAEASRGWLPAGMGENVDLTA